MSNQSWSANQSKPEPFPASATEAEAETPGEADSSASRAVAGGQEAPGTSEQLPVVQGVHVPDVEEPDTRG